MKLYRLDHHRVMERLKDFTLFQKLVNSFQEYYNNSKPHKSLRLMTPMDYFDKLLLDKK